MDYCIITLSDGKEISCHALILALGVSWRRLNVPGVEKFTGSGVYYGAAKTEAPSCKGEDVYVVGGANSAGQAAMYFSKFARKVNMLVRGESLVKSMSQYLIEQINNTDNIEVMPFHSVKEATGDGRLEALLVEDSQTGEVKTLSTSYLFIFIGATPSTEWLGDAVKRDERGLCVYWAGYGGECALAFGARSLPARNQRSRHFCSWRRAPWLSQTSCLGRRRRLYLRAVCSPPLSHV